MEQHLQKKILQLTGEVESQETEMTDLKEQINQKNKEKEEMIQEND